MGEQEGRWGREKNSEKQDYGQGFYENNSNRHDTGRRGVSTGFGNYKNIMH